MASSRRIVELREVVFSPDDDRALTRCLLPEFREWREGWTLHAVYPGADPTGAVMVRCFSSTEPELSEGPHDHLSRFLVRTHPRSFWETLTAVDVYHLEAWEHRAATASVPRAAGPVPSVVEEILRDSGGLVLWHHQLELLLRLFVRETSQVSDLQCALGARRLDAFEFLESMVFEGGETLRAVVHRRMPYAFTKTPNVVGARRLWKLLEHA